MGHLGTVGMIVFMVAIGSIAVVLIFWGGPK